MKKNLTAGTITIIPKNPNTTDGIPEKTFINKFIKFASFLGQKQAKNIAVKIPIGAPNKSAPTVTVNEHKINGNIP